jgi:hypothetical protein
VPGKLLICVRYYACLAQLTGNFLEVLQAGGRPFSDICSDSEDGVEVPRMEEIDIKICRIVLP